MWALQVPREQLSCCLGNVLSRHLPSSPHIYAAPSSVLSRDLGLAPAAQEGMGLVEATDREKLGPEYFLWQISGTFSCTWAPRAYTKLEQWSYLGAKQTLVWGAGEARSVLGGGGAHATDVRERLSC